MKIKKFNQVNEEFNYYKSEISKLDPLNDQYSVHIKLHDSNNSTKWMELNKESAEILHQWLEDNYLKK